ncbi:ATP-binding protein [Chryseobacterium gotjawalense]|uniref:ATP-binding protein n=1 Tax=Chryseobacterium gotjawalense TaxID=3042315 RepID=A0ABY8RBG2_9FLAO|nr:ATP-binding protein [Chryseobacterium sp. wdc7]WHF51305.1 ATP-binding protein [Chryseobacterium sp. wdc7]
MIHSKHKKYRLESITDNTAWVYDIANQMQHRCFVLDHKIGDEFYLFEREMNIFNGHITFEYSILNLYEVGKIYNFEIVKETEKVIVVSNYSRLEIAVPLSFKESEDQEDIDLEIYDLDLAHNKLKFKSKGNFSSNGGEQSEVDYTVFNENEIYTLPVSKTYINRNNNLFAVAEYQGKQFSINIPPTLIQEQIGNNITIHLGFFSDGRPTLKVVRSFVTSKLYKVGDRSNFIIDKQIHDSESGMTYWSLKDQYNMYNNYHPSNDISFSVAMNNLQEGDSLSLYIFRITEKGYLDLVNEITDWDSINYLIEDVFEAIGYEDEEDRYFFNLLSDFENVDDPLVEKKNLSFIDQYNDGENLWVFTYLAFLDSEIFKKLDEGEYEEAKTLTDIYIKIEKWILEGSDYLKNFSLHKTTEIIQKAESKIEKLEAMLNAIDLYLEDKDQDFLLGIKDSLNRSPYLSKSNKNILKELVKISQFFNADSNDENLYDAIFLMIKHGFIQDDDRYTYIRSIESKISRVRDKILEARSENFIEDENVNLRFLVSNQYLLVIFNVLDKNYFRASISSINLLRFLAIYYNDVEYLNFAIKLAVRQGYLHPNILRHSDIYDISLPELKKLSVDSEIKDTYCPGAGRIFCSQAGLEFVPRNLYRKNLIKDKVQIAALDTFNLFISSTLETDPICSEDDLNDLLKKIIAKISFAKQRKEKVEEPLSDNVLNKIYSGRIKSFHNDNQSICYLRCDIDGIKKDTLLHINSYHKVKALSNVADFLQINDLIHFEIIGIEGERIVISPKFALDAYTDELLYEPVDTIGKVVKVYGDKSYVITQEGWPVFLPKSNLTVNDILEVTVSDYSQEHQSFYTSNYRLTDQQYVGETEDNYRNYLISAGMLCEYIDGKETNEDQTEHDNVQSSEETETEVLYDQNLKIISNLVLNCLEQRLFYIKEPKELTLNYFFLIVISGIIKSNKSFIYNSKLNDLAEIVKLEYEEDFEVLSTPETESENGIANLQLDQDSEVFLLIKYINTEILDLPINLPPDSKFYILKKLIESNNLFFSLDKNASVLKYLRKVIISELYNVTITGDKNSIKEFEAVLLGDSTSEENENNKKVITNLGAESKNKEFKTSVFYSASDEPQQKVILRTIAGFLNSYDGGGSLFIGVDDSGDIKGLKNDLSFDDKINTLDNYQNYIQSLVVSVFPKEINALLDYKFHKSNLLNYLEIVVPRFDKPIPFENEFYQRQGVQTRILKGADLVDFMYRKVNISNRIINIQDEVQTEDEVEFQTFDNVHQLSFEEFDNKTELEIQIEDFYADLKKEGDRSANYESLTRENLLGYLYIFKDNTYMMSSAEFDDYLFRVEITEKYKFAHLLLCYDNACVNKVEIRSILNRPFNKRYMNAMSDYGKLMSIFPFLPNSEIAIITQRFDKTYIKLFETKKISEHRIIGLKGNCIVQEDFDQVLAYHPTEKLPEDFDLFRRESKQGLGCETSKDPKLYNVLIKDLS